MPPNSLPANRLAELVSAAASVAGQPGLVAVLNTTVETAMELTGARYGAVGVLGEHGTLVDFIHLGLARDQAGRIGRLPEGRGVLGTITRMRKTIRIDDITKHPDSVGFPNHHPPMSTFLGVPVQNGSTVFGNLYLTDKPEPFTEEDEGVVESLAIIAGAAVATARLHERLRRVALLEDRERIARELHDSVIQDLFAMGLSLQAAAGQVDTQPALVSSRILEAVDQLDTSITTLRQYIFDIRQREWVRRDLHTELLEMADQFTAGHNADVRVVVTGDTTSLDDELVETAMQFVREGTSNALRHSGAPVVHVVATVGVRELLLEVRDAGIGFDPKLVRRGMGLDNLRTRADALGGHTEILSRPGSGTTVRAIIPLQGR